LNDQLDKFGVDAKVVPVEGYDAGVRSVLDRNSNVFFADRSILLDAATRSPSGADLKVLERQFTYAPIALALERGDADFRLVVNRTLSQFFGPESVRFNLLYGKWFGEPDADVDTFFKLTTLPE
jgi:putrescine:ornithine antiporter